MTVALEPRPTYMQDRCATGLHEKEGELAVPCIVPADRDPHCDARPSASLPDMHRGMHNKRVYT